MTENTNDPDIEMVVAPRSAMQLILKAADDAGYEIMTPMSLRPIGYREEFQFDKQPRFTNMQGTQS